MLEENRADITDSLSFVFDADQITYQKRISEVTNCNLLTSKRNVKIIHLSKSSNVDVTEELGSLPWSMEYREFMDAAVAEAEKGLQAGGIPIGSVIVHKGKIVGRGHNQRVQKGSATLHAEMDALENTGCKSASFYKDCVMYTTLSPCAMCTGAILFYKIPRVIIGENENWMGEEELLKARGVQLELLNDQRCKDLMRNFAKEKPELWKEDTAM